MPYPWRPYFFFACSFQCRECETPVQLLSSPIHAICQMICPAVCMSGNAFCNTLCYAYCDACVWVYKLRLKAPASTKRMALSPAQRLAARGINEFDVGLFDGHAFCKILACVGMCFAMHLLRVCMFAQCVCNAHCNAQFDKRFATRTATHLALYVALGPSAC